MEDLREIDAAMRRLQGSASDRSRLSNVEEQLHEINLKLDVILRALVSNSVVNASDVANVSYGSTTANRSPRIANRSSSIGSPMSASWTNTVRDAINGLLHSIVQQMNLHIPCEFHFTAPNQATVMSNVWKYNGREMLDVKLVKANMATWNLIGNVGGIDLDRILNDHQDVKRQLVIFLQRLCMVRDLFPAPWRVPLAAIQETVTATNPASVVFIHNSGFKVNRSDAMNARAYKLSEAIVGLKIQERCDQAIACLTREFAN